MTAGSSATSLCDMSRQLFPRRLGSATPHRVRKKRTAVASQTRWHAVEQDAMPSHNDLQQRGASPRLRPPQRSLCKPTSLCPHRAFTGERSMRLRRSSVLDDNCCRRSQFEVAALAARGVKRLPRCSRPRPPSQLTGHVSRTPAACPTRRRLRRFALLVRRGLWVQLCLASYCQPGMNKRVLAASAVIRR